MGEGRGGEGRGGEWGGLLERGVIKDPYGLLADSCGTAVLKTLFTSGRTSIFFIKECIMQ